MCSIECNREIGFEGAPVNRVHIICGAFVNAGVHLSSGVDLDLRFYTIIVYKPLVNLENIIHL